MSSGCNNLVEWLLGRPRSEGGGGREPELTVSYM